MTILRNISGQPMFAAAVFTAMLFYTIYSTRSRMWLHAFAAFAAVFYGICRLSEINQEDNKFMG